MKIKRLKLSCIIGTILTSIISLNTSALEINIKANSSNNTPVVLGNMNENLKNGIYDDLSKIKNLKIEKSEKTCDKINKDLKTSYYCIDAETNNNSVKISISEKYLDKENKNKSFSFVKAPSRTIESYDHVISNNIYKYMYGKETIFESKIAYVERTDLKNGKKRFKLQIADYNGKNVRTLLSSSQPILSIDWSPNNDMIAYVSYENVRSSVIVQNLKTLKRRKIASFEGVNAFPSWSPNGKMLAISLSKDGSSDIYIYYVGKNHLKKITNFKETAAEPVWINNNEILFTYDKTGSPYLYKLNLEKGKVYPVSKNYLYTTSAKMSNDKKTAYSVFSKNGNAGILKTTLSNRKESVLVSDKYAESPSVGKGDNIIIFSTKENGKNILKAVDETGKKVYEIERANTELKEPSYSK